MSVPAHVSQQLNCPQKPSPPPTPGQIRKRQSMSTSALTDNDQLELSNAQIDELNTSSGFYRNEDDSENEVNARTPMIMAEESSTYRSNQLPIRDKQCYWRVFLTSQCLGLIVFVFLVYLIFGHLGGFSLSNPSITFNFHPFFMVLGFILFYSHAILIYRNFRTEGKPKLKLLHAGLNFSAILFGLCGSASVYYFHEKASIPHFYSLHSWLGIITWSFFTTQFASGFVAYLFPGLSFTFRSMMMPFHRFLGVGTFISATATCLTGLNEKAIFAFKDPAYSSLPSGGIIVNLLGLFILAYVAFIVYLVTKPEYKRIERPEEQMTHLNFDLAEN